MLARQFPGNREFIREFSPTWQGDDNILAAVSDPPRRFLLPRAEAKQVLLALSDYLKVDQHLTYVHAVQFCKFPLHTLDKPHATLRRRLLRFERHDHRPGGLLF